MKWTLENTSSPTLSRRLTAAHMERPWWREDGSQVLSSCAAGNLKQGDIILDLPVRFCLSDVWEEGDPKSLYTDGVPWEVRLASKLLRERKSITIKTRPQKMRWSRCRILPSQRFSLCTLMRLQGPSLVTMFGLCRWFTAQCAK